MKLGWLALALSGGLLAWLTTTTGARDGAPMPAATLIPPDAAVVVSFRVADLWTGDFAKPVREKLAKEAAQGAAEFEKAIGVPPELVERLTLVVLSFGPGTEVFVATLKKPYDRAAVIKRAGDNAKEEKYKGRTLFIGEKGDAICLLDERTFISAKADPLRGLLDRPAADKQGPLTPARKAIGSNHDFVLGLNLPGFLEQSGDDLPGEIEPFKPLLKAQTAVLTADTGLESRAEVVLTFANALAAKEAGKSAKEGLDLAKASIAAGRIALAKDPSIIGLLDLAELVVKGTQTEVQGDTLKAVARAKLDPGAAAPLLAQALGKQRGAAGRVQSQNNLKQIALAMHNFHDAYSRFPAAAIYDNSGKPLLSWRVLILPFIEQDDLFKQFHLDEPWDSDHNKKLLERMPRTYSSSPDKPTHQTHYQGFHGKGAFFEGKKGITIAEIPDGTSNTIMVVEATGSVPWTKPEDLPYDPSKPLPKLGGLFPGGFNAAFCDGSVRFISDKVKPETLHLLIQRNDGTPIPNDF
jgi:prepilin-type processing-associated H-X9-DG protein